MKTLEIKSTAFVPMGMIPDKFTCKGINVSPPLRWAGAPDGVNSFALIHDDPDAVSGTWVHWIIFNNPLPTAE